MIKNPSKIRELQNCPGTPTVKTRSKIQNEKKKTTLKSQNRKTFLIPPQSKPAQKSKLSNSHLKSMNGKNALVPPQSKPVLKSKLSKTHLKSK